MKAFKIFFSLLSLSTIFAAPLLNSAPFLKAENDITRSNFLALLLLSKLSATLLYFISFRQIAKQSGIKYADSKSMASYLSSIYKKFGFSSLWPSTKMLLISAFTFGLLFKYCLYLSGKAVYEEIRCNKQLERALI
jgi:hypothetical protein